MEARMTMTKQTHLLDAPPAQPLIAPSILSADFGRLVEDCRDVLDAGADLLHVDVMDGHFVPNLSMGPAVCGSLRRHLPDVYLDVHLMVEDPGMFLEPFVAAGANHITVHVEVAEDPAALAERIRELGASPGLALNPETPVEAVLPHLEAFDLALVMSVHPGYSGQSFIPDVLEKVRVIRSQFGDAIRIEADGGVSPSTAGDCREAGYDVLVSGSSVFGSADRAADIAAIRGTG
jgi:ribulose-phosphate 3-epimerase